MLSGKFGLTSWSVALVLAAGVVTPRSGHAQEQVRLTPEQATQLMKLDQELAERENKVLVEDAPYQEAVAAAAEAKAALGEHRSVHERVRDEDTEYREAQSRYKELSRQIARLDREFASANGDNLDAVKRVSILRAKVKNLRNQVDGHRRRLAKWQERYDIISTKTGTTMAGYEHLDKKIAHYTDLVNDAESRLREAEGKLSDAEDDQAAAEDTLRPIREERKEARVELSRLTPAYKKLEALWEGRYRGDPRTIELQAAVATTGAKEKSAKAACLSELKRSDSSYAQLVSERITIKPFTED